MKQQKSKVKNKKKKGKCRYQYRIEYFVAAKSWITQEEVTQAFQALQEEEEEEEEAQQQEIYQPKHEENFEPKQVLENDEYQRDYPEDQEAEIKEEIQEREEESEEVAWEEEEEEGEEEVDQEEEEYDLEEEEFQEEEEQEGNEVEEEDDEEGDVGEDCGGATRAGRFECNLCPAILSNSTHLKEHINRWHSSTKDGVVCEGCGKSYASKKGLREHKRKHCKSKKKSDTKQQSDNKERVVCLICGHSYASKKGLGRHMRENHGEIASKTSKTVNTVANTAIVESISSDEDQEHLVSESVEEEEVNQFLPTGSKKKKRQTARKSSTNSVTAASKQKLQDADEEEEEVEEEVEDDDKEENSPRDIFAPPPEDLSRLRKRKPPERGALICLSDSEEDETTASSVKRARGDESDVGRVAKYTARLPQENGNSALPPTSVNMGTVPANSRMSDPTHTDPIADDEADEDYEPDQDEDDDSDDDDDDDEYLPSHVQKKKTRTKLSGGTQATNTSNLTDECGGTVYPMAPVVPVVPAIPVPPVKPVIHVHPTYGSVTFKCEKCHNLLPSKKALQEHLRNCSYKCWQCGRTYRHKKALQGHITKDNCYIDCVVKEVMTNVVTLIVNREKRVEQVVGDVMNNVVDTIVAKEEMENSGQNQNTDEGNTDTIALTSSHNINTVVSCNVCHNYFTNQAELSRHVCRVTQYNPSLKFVSCKVCSNYFINEVALAKHKCPAATKSKPVKAKSIKQFKCEECSVVLATSHMLHRHKLEVHGKAVHKCVGCGKSFNRRSDLRRHILHRHVSVVLRSCTCQYELTPDDIVAIPAKEASVSLDKNAAEVNSTTTAALPSSNVSLAPGDAGSNSKVSSEIVTSGTPLTTGDDIETAGDVPQNSDVPSVISTGSGNVPSDIAPSSAVPLISDDLPPNSSDIPPISSDAPSNLAVTPGEVQSTVLPTSIDSTAPECASVLPGTSEVK